MKDAVRFYDPVDNQPVKIPVAKEMKAYVRLEEEKLEDKRRELAKQKDDDAERLKAEKENITVLTWI